MAFTCKTSRLAMVTTGHMLRNLFHMRMIIETLGSRWLTYQVERSCLGA